MQACVPADAQLNTLGLTAVSAAAALRVWACRHVYQQMHSWVFLASLLWAQWRPDAT